MPPEEERVYRPSASLIIASRTDGESYNYKLLLIKRTLHTSYAPDHCVFPGGVFEVDADESADWLCYFEKFGIEKAALQMLESCSMKRPQPLLTGGIAFSRDISLRITAIREAFEEVGILLCRSKQTIKHSATEDFCPHVCVNFDPQHWQHIVHNDPKQFLKLCQYLEVVPDLWCLHEWSVWRSPVSASRKFDTAFYFVALESIPELLLERSEVEVALWETPDSFLTLFCQRHLWLPPIQMYELSRLRQVYDGRKLLSFARERSKQGSTILKPAYYECSNGLVGALQGDDFYPTDANKITKTIVIESSVEEFLQKARRIHRLHIYDMYDQKVEINIPALDGHLSPGANHFRGKL